MVAGSSTWNSPLRDTVRHHPFQCRADPVDMVPAHPPTLRHGGFHHLMDARVVLAALDTVAVKLPDDFRDPLVRAEAGSHGDARDQCLDLTGDAFDHRLVDGFLRFEESIDIGRAHPERLGDVGDGGLLVADLAKETLCRRQNPASCRGGRVFQARLQRVDGDCHKRTLNLLPPAVKNTALNSGSSHGTDERRRNDPSAKSKRLIQETVRSAEGLVGPS